MEGEGGKFPSGSEKRKKEERKGNGKIRKEIEGKGKKDLKKEEKWRENKRKIEKS